MSQSPDRVLLGQAYLDAGNFAAAEEEARIVLSETPDNDLAWAVLHSAVQNRAGRIEAQTVAEDWLARLPDSQRALYELASGTISLRKDKERSRALVESYQATYPGAVVDCKLLTCLYEVVFGNKNAATEIAREIAEEHGDAAGGILVFEGLVNYEADCCRQAYRFGKGAVALVPNEPQAWRLLAISAFRELRFFEARRAAKNALAIEPTMDTMKIVKVCSAIGWFPLFVLGSLISLITMRFLCVVQVKGIARSLLGVGCSYLLAVYALVPILKWLAIQGVALGLPNLLWPMFAVVLSWMLIPELLFNYSESDRVKKPASVKLKDY